MCKPEAPLSPTLLGGGEQHVNAIRGASALLSLLQQAEKSQGNFSDGAIRGRPYQDLCGLY